MPFSGGLSITRPRPPVQELLDEHRESGVSPGSYIQKTYAREEIAGFDFYVLESQDGGVGSNFTVELRPFSAITRTHRVASSIGQPIPFVSLDNDVTIYSANRGSFTPGSFGWDLYGISGIDLTTFAEFLFDHPWSNRTTVSAGATIVIGGAHPPSWLVGQIAYFFEADQSYDLILRRSFVDINGSTSVNEAIASGVAAGTVSKGVVPLLASGPTSLRFTNAGGVTANVRYWYRYVPVGRELPPV